MAFLLEHTRARVLRRSDAASAPRLPTLSGLALPRPLRGVPAAISVLAIAAAALAGLSLHQPQPRAATGVRAPALIGAGGPLSGLSLPAGTSLAPTAATTTQLTALLAADLWQAATQVYQEKLLGQTAAPAPTPAAAASGPSVAQLLQAQLRLTQAQLAYQAVTQTATAAQLTAAREAVAAAQAQVLAAQQAVQAASAATATASPASTPAPAPTDAELQQAQADVNAALAAFQRVEHPYTADQIAAAQNDLATLQQALAAAQTTAAPSATPAQTVSPTPSPTPTATAPASTTTVVAGPGSFPAPAAGVMQPPLATAPILQNASNAGVGGATYYGPGAVRAPDGATANPGAEPLASATPAPTPSPTPSPTPAAASPTPAPPSANVLALQQQVTAAQQTLARMTAAPDPVLLQQAADKVAAAQGRLSDLKAAQAAAEAATPTPAPAPSATPAPSADTLTPEQQLAQAQAQYDAAQQQLQALTRQPDPATVKAAQDELTAAQQAWQALLAQADSSVVAQVNADPQTALRQYAAAGITTNGPDPVPFAWPARGPISSLFGPSHLLGIDIAQGAGLPVTAAASGVVSFSGGDPCCSYGYYVDITHPGGYTTRYGHLLLPSYLKPGDPVRQGQIIGLSGSTGFSTGPHLHFEIRLNGVPLDPLKLLAGALPRPLSP